MNEQTFYLFRITLHEKILPDMFASNLSKTDFLFNLVYYLQAKETTRNLFWHIGNVEEIDKKSLYFRFGRVTKKQISELDNQGNFVDNNIELAKYSHCIIDCNLQFLALSFNSNLSPNINSLGNWLEKILNSALNDYPDYESIEVRIIPDYKEFLSKIKESYSVNRFWIKIKKPNPFDLDDDFIKPISKLNKEMFSDEIKVEMAGEDLNRSNIEKLTESTTLAGSEGGAYVHPTENSKTQYINLGKNNLSFQIEFDDSKKSKKKILEEIRNRYKKIRENFGK